MSKSLLATALGLSVAPLSFGSGLPSPISSGRHHTKKGPGRKPSIQFNGQPARNPKKRAARLTGKNRI